MSERKEEVEKRTTTISITQDSWMKLNRQKRIGESMADVVERILERFGGGE